LIVLAIFQKVRAGTIERSFPERIIVETIKAVLHELGMDSARGEETAKYDETLHRLLRHFLDKNIEEKTYQLSSYAENFCDMLEREVHTAINPSQIQKTFNDLVLLLSVKLETMEDFRHWYHTQFFKHKSDIGSQLRGLQAQIEDTVDQLNELVKNEQDNFREMLIGCEALLDRIKEQADKLSSAFSSKDDIKQLLDDATLVEEFEFREMKREVRVYFKDIEQRLINVSHTIDRIKPKINKLYNDFEKRDFDRKIESFLLYMLKNSTSKFGRAKKLIGRTVHEVEVFLPPNIAVKEYYSDRSRITGIDFSKFDLDQPLPELKTNGHQSSLAKWIGKTPRSIVQSYASKAGIDFTGTIDHVAGMMQDIMEEVGGDGFLLFNGYFDRRYIMEVCDGLVPELQRRGLTRKKFAHKHFMDNLREFSKSFKLTLVAWFISTAVGFWIMSWK